MLKKSVIDNRIARHKIAQEAAEAEVIVKVDDDNDENIDEIKIVPPVITLVKNECFRDSDGYKRQGPFDRNDRDIKAEN